MKKASYKRSENTKVQGYMLDLHGYYKATYGFRHYAKRYIKRAERKQRRFLCAQYRQNAEKDI